MQHEPSGQRCDISKGHQPSNGGREDHGSFQLFITSIWGHGKTTSQVLGILKPVGAEERRGEGERDGEGDRKGEGEGEGGGGGREKRKRRGRGAGGGEEELQEP